MKIKLIPCLFLTLIASLVHADPLGTAFTYQGSLNANGVPANGSYDFIFTLYTNSTAGSQISALPVSAVPVSNGLFTASVDFGNVFDGTAYWLGISLRTNNTGSYSPLNPRQPITPAPYSIQAMNANSASNLLGTLPSSQLSGPLTLAQLPTAVVTNNSSGLNLNGTFSGDGSGLYNTVTTENYVHAYDTTIQTPSTTHTFQAVTFDATATSGWTYSGSAATFTCGQSGMYFVEYDATIVTGSISGNTATISLRAVNETTGEIPASECFGTLAANQNAVVSKSFLASFSAGDALQILFDASSTAAGLAPGTFDAAVKPSISLTIIRIQ